MLQRIVDETVLSGFSLLFRMAVFALKRRRPRTRRSTGSALTHGSAFATGSDRSDRAAVARAV
jgi:hypothetical protein